MDYFINLLKFFNTLDNFQEMTKLQIKENLTNYYYLLYVSFQWNGGRGGDCYYLTSILIQKHPT